MRQPPRVVTWLLERFGVRESLVGDLIEQYEHGRSLRWFCQQALLAVTFEAVTDVKIRPTLAAPLMFVTLTSLFLVLLPIPWLERVITVWIAAYACTGLGVVLLSLSSSR